MLFVWLCVFHVASWNASQRGSQRLYGLQGAAENSGGLEERRPFVSARAVCVYRPRSVYIAYMPATFSDLEQDAVLEPRKAIPSLV